MKIAILTYHRAFSYGALLQCYALSTFLHQQGHEVKLLRSDLHGENTWKYWLNSYTKCSSFRNFRKHFLPSEANSGEQFDLYIVGSDQVWNPSFPLRPLDYYFSFLSPVAKRISYAASFGMNDWDLGGEMTKKIQECLCRFSTVTVREQSSANICRDVFGIHADIVLDPTLLLGDFENLYSVPINEKNGTLFCYRVSQQEDWGSLSKDIANKLGLKLYTPLPVKRIKCAPNMGGLNTVHLSVQEWLDAIRSSSFVLTDSFHTMVFAILNRKPFLVLPSVKSRMGRVTSLLSILNIEEHYKEVGDIIDVDKLLGVVEKYDEVFSLLSQQRLKSIHVFKDCLLI